MARDVEADVNINDKSSRGLSSFLGNLRKGSDGAKKLQGDVDKSAASVGKLTGQTDKNVKAFAKLSDELAISRKELGSLARSFADAGTAAERLDITKAMKRQQAEIRNLTKNTDILGDLIPDPKSNKLVGRLKESLEEVAAAAPQIIGGGIAAAAPFAGAVLSAAIIGSVGTAGIIGGVALAAKDPRVVAAFTGMKTRVGAELRDSAAPFVDTTIRGIGKIEDALGTIDFDAVFAKSAQNAGPVIDGIARAVQELGDGIESVIQNSGPVMEQLGATIGDLGKETGEFLDTIGKGSDGAAAGLADLTGVIGTVLDILGPTILVLSTFYGWLSKIGVAGQFMVGLLGPIGQVVDLLDKAGVGAEGTGQKMRLLRGDVDQAAAATGAGATKFDEYGRAVLTSGEAVATFTDKINNLNASGQGLYDSATRVGAAVDAISESVDKNGRSLDANSEKGRANRDVLSGLASALLGQYNAAVKVNGEGPVTDAVAAKNRETFVRLAGQFKISKSAAEDLATAMGLIPPKKTIDAHANTHDAEARIKALQEQVNSLKGKTIDVTVRYSSTGRERLTEDGHRVGGYSAGDYRFGHVETPRAEPARGTLAERVDLRVELDGQVVYTNTARQVRASSKRDAWRQRVGRV